MNETRYKNLILRVTALFAVVLCLLSGTQAAWAQTQRGVVAGENVTKVNTTDITTAGQVVGVSQGSTVTVNVTPQANKVARVTVSPTTVAATSASITGAQSVTYGGSTTLTVNVVPVFSDDKTVTWSCTDSRVTFSNATTVGTDGKATVTVTGAAAGTTTITASVGNVTSAGYALTVEKANPTYTAPANANPTFNRSAQEYITTGSTDHGTIQYSTNGSDWSTSRPTATNAGSYTCYYRIVGDANHSDVASTSVACTIAQMGISGFTMTTTNPTFTGATVTSTVTLKDGSYTLTANTDYTVSGNTTIDSDYEQRRTATCTGKGNYTGTKTANWYCARAEQNPSISITNNGTTATIYNACGTVNWYIINAKGVITSHLGEGTSVSLNDHLDVLRNGGKVRADCSGDANHKLEIVVKPY